VELEAAQLQVQVSCDWRAGSFLVASQKPGSTELISLQVLESDTDGWSLASEWLLGGGSRAGGCNVPSIYLAGLSSLGTFPDGRSSGPQ
jgi:hypothetical protein